MLTLAYDRASQRITCPHLNTAVPSGSVSITILDDSGDEKLAATTATKGTLSTSTTVAASAGATTITTSDAAGASVDQPIVIQDASGRSELAIIGGFETTTDTINLRDRLSRAYAIGATVKSAWIYYDLDASDADTWPVDIYYQALFSCSTWSSVRAVMFRIVDLQTLSPITYEHLRKWLPHASTLRDVYDKPALDEARESAWDYIKTLLRAAERDPEVWRDADEIGGVGGLLAAALFCLSHGEVAAAKDLVGDPIGSGGLWKTYWPAACAALGWFDTDQDRARDRMETVPVAQTRFRRGL